jgi:hypothetical protein
MRRDTRLRLSDAVGIRVAGDWMIVEGRDDAVRCERRMLSALDRLQRPGTFEDAMSAVETGSRHDWMSAAAQLLELVGAGAVCDGEQQTGRLLTDHGFSWLEPHIAMISDQQRTQSYIAAIKRVVRPGDVVVDLGTGTGVLAIAAAQAGARHVYAIERTHIADVAARMFFENGVADRVTIVRDVSTHAVLPERANVMTSEIIGTEPLCERILEYTSDAIDRHLCAGARMVPRGLRISARAVSLPDGVVERHVATERLTAGWAQTYGMDFSALAGAGLPAWFSASNAEAASWPALSPTIQLMDIDLAQPPRPPLSARARTIATAAGRLDAILIVWQAELDAHGSLSSDPLIIGPDCCWGAAVWLAQHRTPVVEGDELEFRFHYTAPRASADVALQRPAGFAAAAG